MSVRGLELDLVAPARRGGRTGSLLLLLAVVASGAVGWQHRALHDELLQLEAQAGPGRSPAPAPSAMPVSAPRARQAVLEVQQAAQVAGRLNVPWETLFTALETAATPDVALLAIESEAGRRSVRLSGEARQLGALLAYVRSLRARSVLTDVFLHSHEMQAQDPQHPVRFSIAASWAGAGRSP